MSRILMTWEMGLNLGHLTRLLPLAVRLKSRGHVVLGAVCDIPSAASVFGPAGIPFVQVPRLTNGMRLSHRPGAYADVLLLHGWGDRNALWGLVQAWLSLFQLFKPELMVLDHSPTALLAARIAKIKTGLIGNGFELPPATNPLPAFPGFSWASDEKAAESERIAVDNANAVARAFGGAPITALRDLFDVEASLLTSFPELDHYGARPGAKYVGLLQGQPACEPTTWPEGQRRIFAYIRPDTEGAEAILGALAACGASVVCFAPGFTQEQLQRYRTPNMRFSSKPVELKPLLQDADACVSYGAEGTVATFLLAGVPQLLAPKYVEAHLAARRVEELGAGLVLRGAQTVESVAAALNKLLTDAHYKQRAQAFADRHREFDPTKTADEVVLILEQILSKDVRNDRVVQREEMQVVKN